MLGWSYLGVTVFPIVVALVLAFIGKGRKIIVPLSALVIAASGISLVQQPDLSSLEVAGLLDGIVVAEVGIIALLTYWGFKRKNLWIIGFNAVQLGLLLWMKVSGHGAVTESLLVMDNLTKILLLLITVIGPLICLFAVPYMDEYEAHKGLTKSKQGRFFFLLYLFLGGMSLLVTANHLSLLALGWEITTLCSFLLISHNQDEESIQNGTTALLLNSFGGLALAIGTVVSEKVLEINSINGLLAVSEKSLPVLMVVALLALAGLTKAAQMPFQKWLLGAMVAPTPVSALLHSSTMVKAGVYLILRLAPAYQGTGLSTALATIGGFTFLMTSALAISQNNGKRILAYSTIANLGLIVFCAGVNTPLALGAAIFLVIFHAISKALLFLCVGTIELKIGSKDIEMMHGLVEKAPYIAFASIIGMLTMFLPPFGMMAGKWAAMEAAAQLPLVALMVVLGSALTIVFWLRWAGSIMTTTKNISEIPKEQHSWMVALPLNILIIAAVMMSLLTDQVFTWALSLGGTVEHGMQQYMVGPVFAVMLVAVIVGLIVAKRASKAKVTSPYMCGETVESEEPGHYGFYAFKDEVVPYKIGHYYLTSWFGEGRLTTASNVIAALLIVFMFGVNMI